MSKKLHIICGMCGCADELDFHIDLEGNDVDGKLVPAVYISCDNCCTLTTLDEHMPEKPAIS